MRAEDKKQNENSIMIWPTARHEKFGEHIYNICCNNDIGLLIKGSICFWDGIESIGSIEPIDAKMICITEEIRTREEESKKSKVI